MTGTAKHIQRERQAVEAQIREAFRGVTRDGGVSWRESMVIDGYGSSLDQEQARALDTERRWEDLVEDPAWIHEPHEGGLTFLDPIGFRYYIAPLMIRCIRENGGDHVSFNLERESEWALEQSSLLNAQQAHVIARFIRLMITVHLDNDDDIYGRHWIDAYKKRWRRHDRGTPLEF
ncbi:MAG: hypothetical protein K2W85_08965 [Phycisphaerales bacterium]|nr:hypothetical protein [Phycisphaerales bacterium]